jgi:hypothetical protein
MCSCELAHSWDERDAGDFNVRGLLYTPLSRIPHALRALSLLVHGHPSMSRLGRHPALRGLSPLRDESPAVGLMDDMACGSHYH